ncbi:MAG: hypothetical protein JNL70_07480 [Saprospiraceae bacterium]|nr:hypothetical protein [Saprospiraceae bacterium]
MLSLIEMLTPQYLDLLSLPIGFTNATLTSKTSATSSIINLPCLFAFLVPLSLFLKSKTDLGRCCLPKSVFLLLLLRGMITHVRETY